MKTGICIVDDCGGPKRIKALGMCITHYHRQHKWGNPHYRQRYRSHNGEGHGTPEYAAWQSMKNRCFNAHAKGFKHYGGRGITVAPVWRMDFPAFLQHVGNRPSDDHSLDRIDVNGNYEPGNVRWATRFEQAANQRRRIDNTSGATGVRWDKSSNLWAVEVRRSNRLRGALVSSREEAVKLRDEYIHALDRELLESEHGQEWSGDDMWPEVKPKPVKKHRPKTDKAGWA